MHTTYRGVATIAAALTAFTLASAPTSAAADTYSGATVSRYVPLTANNSDLTAAENAGCAEGKKGIDGVRFFFVGTQESGDVLRQPGTTASSGSKRVSTDHAVDAAAAWAKGFAECRTGDAQADLALAVNNKSDGNIKGATAGKKWADVVTQAAQANNDAVTITGGIDAEPSWSAPKWARDWVDAYTGANDTTLYAGNSADGCPQPGSSSTTCNNGWTLADVHYVAAGAASTIEAIPQIYRTDGVQARQWAAISSWGARNGNGPVRFAGSLSQHTACGQRGGCSTTNNTPKDAWTQLFEELNNHNETAVSSLPTATDVRWP